VILLLITLFILTHSVNFPCGRKPEHTEKTHDFRQSVDSLFSRYESLARIGRTGALHGGTVQYTVYSLKHRSLFSRSITNICFATQRFTHIQQNHFMTQRVLGLHNKQFWIGVVYLHMKEYCVFMSYHMETMNFRHCPNIKVQITVHFYIYTNNNRCMLYKLFQSKKCFKGTQYTNIIWVLCEIRLFFKSLYIFKLLIRWVRDVLFNQEMWEIITVSLNSRVNTKVKLQLGLTYTGKFWRWLGNVSCWKVKIVSAEILIERWIESAPVLERRAIRIQLPRNSKFWIFTIWI
jgi:hypothetical protein